MSEKGVDFLEGECLCCPSAASNAKMPTAELPAVALLLFVLLPKALGKLFVCVLFYQDLCVLVTAFISGIKLQLSVAALREAFQSP